MLSDDAAPAVSAELRALDPSLAPPGGANGDGPGAAPPGGGTPAPGVSDADRVGAMVLASLVVGVIGQGIAKRWPATAYTLEEKQSLSIVLAPLFVKYGFNAAWLARWRAEFSALGVFAQLALVGYQRVQAAPPPAPQDDPPPLA